jgi:hypothetical protein
VSVSVVTKVQLARVGMGLDREGPSTGAVLKIGEDAYRSQILEHGVPARCRCSELHVTPTAALLCLFQRMGCWLT